MGDRITEDFRLNIKYKFIFDSLRKKKFTAVGKINYQSFSGGRVNLTRKILSQISVEIFALVPTRVVSYIIILEIRSVRVSDDVPDPFLIVESSYL